MRRGTDPNTAFRVTDCPLARTYATGDTSSKPGKADWKEPQVRDERTMFERTRLMRRTRRMLAVLIAVGGLLTLSLGSALAHTTTSNAGRHLGWAAHDWSSKLALLEANEAADEDNADEAEGQDAEGPDEDAQGDDQGEDADEDDQGENEDADENDSDDDEDEADEDDGDAHDGADDGGEHDGGGEDDGGGDDGDD